MNIPSKVRLTVEVNMIPTDPFGYTPQLCAQRVQKLFDYFCAALDGRVVKVEGVEYAPDAHIDGMELLEDGPVAGSELLEEPIDGAELLELPGSELLQ